MYSRVNVSVGDTAELMCNTSQSSGIMWTYDNDTEDGYVHYVYWRGVADKHKPRLSAKSRSVGVHSLVVDDTELTDSGLYDCYDGEGSRQVGYQLIVNGILWFITHIYLRLFIYITTLKATPDGKSTR